MPTLNDPQFKKQPVRDEPLKNVTYDANPDIWLASPNIEHYCPEKWWQVKLPWWITVLAFVGMMIAIGALLTALMSNVVIYFLWGLSLALEEGGL